MHLSLSKRILAKGLYEVKKKLLDFYMIYWPRAKLALYQIKMTLTQTILSNPFYLIPILLWTVTWKGLALWKCGRNNQPQWFVALLIINTVGIFEIIYLQWFQKDRNKRK